jgi:hypothetical protein
MSIKRAHILFDIQLWTILTTLAEARKTSVAKLIREAVAEKYAREDELSTRRKAIESILKHRPTPVKGKIDYKALINYGRRY